MTSSRVQPRKRHRSGRWAAAQLALLFGVSSAGWAANPFTATYSHDREAVFWILHLSDAHIGASVIEGPHASEQLAWALGEAIEVIGPAFVVNTGDLVDGSLAGIPASGQSQGEWDDYTSMVAEAGLYPDFYLDLAGNHDGYGDIGLDYYRDNSMNGVYTGLPYREVWLSFPFGDYLVCGVNTAGEGSNAFVEAPAYTDDQVVALTGALDPSEDAELVLLFGHHRITRPDNADPVITLAQQNGAFWFHGHEHEFGSYLEEFVVSGQVNSIGKRDFDNLAVVAVDNNAVSYAATSSAEPWPMVVVTAPADSRLDGGEVNPYAYPVCNTGSANPVRALVFDSAPVIAVSFTAGTADPVAMTQDEAEPRLWYGSWDTTGLAPGEITLSVAAQGSTTHAAAITVDLAAVACPPPPPVDHPDAGPPDGGLGPDAGGALDAGVVGTDAAAGVDSGDPPGDGGGCGCRTGDRSGGALVPWLLVFWWLGRRRGSVRASKGEGS